MDFLKLADERQSCRKYDVRPVEGEKLDRILAAARLSPSACNGQPYHITFAAAAEGLGSCMLGWFDDSAIREVCGLSMPVRLVITLGYPLDGHRDKKRKPLSELVTEVE